MSVMRCGLFLLLLLFTFGQAEGNEEKPLSIDYCIDPDWLPYEAIRDGEHVGISSDYLNILSEALNIDFRLVRTSSWTQTLDYLREGQCHFAPMLNQTDSRDRFLNFSDVYFSAPNVIISTKDQPFLQSVENIAGQRLGVPEGYRMVEFLQTYYPEIEFIQMSSEKAALHAVANGEIDLTISSILSANSYIASESLYNLKISGWAILEDRLRMGVSPEYSHLLPAINEVLNNIDDGQHLHIYQQWGNAKIISEPDYRLLQQVLLVALVIFALLLIYFQGLRQSNRKLQRKNAELKSLHEQLEVSNNELNYISTHDPLTQLYNRHYLSQEMQRRSNDSEQTCVLIADIDNFKTINDTHGHSAGDDILQEFAQVLKEVVRGNDVVARWGGEEFVILCPQTDMKAAQLLCQRLLEAVRSHTFCKVGKLNCSIGGAALRDDETINQCLDRADQALYRAKNAGRDTWLWDEK